MQNLQGSDFYHTEAGRINATIITKPTVALNRRLIEEHGPGLSGLIMGYGEGEMLEGLKDLFHQIKLVEGSEDLCRLAKNRFSQPNIEIIHSYFENYEMEPLKKVGWVLGNHILEHVDNPVEVLSQAKKWLKEDGQAIFTVPNAGSLHRRIGVKMGILEKNSSMSENDYIVGHQRVYDAESFARDCEKGGFEILSIKGYNLKMVSQKQMAEWSSDLLKAILEVSLDCPVDICSNLLILAK